MSKENAALGNSLKEIRGEHPVLTDRLHLLMQQYSDAVAERAELRHLCRIQRGGFGNMVNACPAGHKIYSSNFTQITKQSIYV